MSFLKVLGQMVSVAVFNVFVYIFQDGSTSFFNISVCRTSDLFCIIFVVNRVFEKGFGDLLLI